MSVRPTVVYGPYDYTERFAYWVDRVAEYDRVVVPSDGLSLWQTAYVEDVASALRLVAERGTAGEAYNVGDEHAPTLREWVDLLARVHETDVETIGVGERELGRRASPDDVPIYRDSPHRCRRQSSEVWAGRRRPTKRLGGDRRRHLENDRTGRESDLTVTRKQRLLTASPVHSPRRSAVRMPRSSSSGSPTVMPSLPISNDRSVGSKPPNRFLRTPTALRISPRTGCHFEVVVGARRPCVHVGRRRTHRSAQQAWS